MTAVLRVAFLTGGSGFVGGHLIRYLRQRNIQVRALVRSERAAQLVQEAGAEPVYGNLEDEQVLENSMAGCDVVFHLAARTAFWGRYEDAYRDNVLGTRHLLAAARAAGVPRFVYVSTEAILADGKPLVRVDETCPRPERPIGIYGLTKGLAEEQVRSMDSAELATVIARPRFIWGPGMPALDQMTRMVRAGSFLWIDGGHYLTSTCHVTNVCEGLLLAAERGGGGMTYFLSDGTPVEFRAFASQLLLTQGVEPGTRSVPGGFARALASLSESIWRFGRLKKEPPLTREAVALIGAEVTVDDSLARRELGYEGLIRREEGLRELAQADKLASSPLK